MLAYGTQREVDEAPTYRCRRGDGSSFLRLFQSSGYVVGVIQSLHLSHTEQLTPAGSLAHEGVLVCFISVDTYQ